MNKNRGKKDICVAFSIYLTHKQESFLLTIILIQKQKQKRLGYKTLIKKFVSSIS